MENPQNFHKKGQDFKTNFCINFSKGTYLIEPMLKLFEEYFIFMYQELMNEVSFVEQSIGVVLNSFEQLEKKINEFTESKRKKYEESINQEAPIPQEITIQ